MHRTFGCPMSIENKKWLVRRYYEEVGNTGNLDEIEQYISPEYTEVYENKRHSVGVAGAKAHIVGVRQTYPDLHITIERQIAEGEWVVSCITARETHKGVWLGMKPTNRPVAMSGINVDRVVNGNIVEHGGAINMLEATIEIGAIAVASPDN
jgi:predicted ester cyclase